MVSVTGNPRDVYEQRAQPLEEMEGEAVAVPEGSGWYNWYGDTVGYSSSVVYRGSQSLEMGIDASSSNDGAAARRDYDQPQDLSDVEFSTVVRWDGPTDGWYDLTFRVLDSADNWRQYTALVLGDDMNGQWYRVNFQYDSESSTAPDLTDVTAVQFSFWAGSGVDASVYLDDLRTTPKADRGQVVFTFDDSRETHYTEAFPVMSEQGIAATTAVMADEIGTTGYLTTEQLQTLYDAGWCVSLHPQESEHLPAYSKSKQRDLIQSNRQWLLDHGFDRGADTIVYPYGSADTDTLSVAAEFCEIGALAGGGTTPVYAAAPLTLNRVDAGASKADAKAAIDEAEAHGTTATLMYHTFGPNGETSTADLREVCRYARKANVDIVTLDEWRRRLDAWAWSA